MGAKGRRLNLVYMMVTHTLDNNISSFMCSKPSDGSQNLRQRNYVHSKNAHFGRVAVIGDYASKECSNATIYGL